MEEYDWKEENTKPCGPNKSKKIREERKESVKTVEAGANNKKIYLSKSISFPGLSSTTLSWADFFPSS